MKKINLLLAGVMALSLAACAPKAPAGEQKTEDTAAVTTWTRTGFYQDDKQNLLSVNVPDPEVTKEEGWMVGCFLGTDAYSGVIQENQGVLEGTLKSDLDKPGTIDVRVREEGEQGLILEVNGNDLYYFSPMTVPSDEETITVEINREGEGHFTALTDSGNYQADDEITAQCILNLKEPADYTLKATPDEGSRFVKWTKDGQDFSTEAEIKITCDADAKYVAVFDEMPAEEVNEPAAEESGN